MLLKFKMLSAIFMAALLLVGCGIIDKEQKLILTNPTEQTIQVKIDDQEYNVEPEGATPLNLKVGNHTMIVPGGETVNFKVYNNSTGGIINPTKSAHIVYTMIYAIDDKASNSFMPPVKEVLIDGTVYEGPIQTTDAMFIDNNVFRCTYFVGEPFPEEIMLGDKNSKGNLRSKYFTKKEFIDFYAEETGEANSATKGETQITSNVIYDLPVVDFANQAEQEQALKIVSTLKSYMSANDSSEQEKYQKQYNEQLIALVGMQDHSSVSENEKYSDFVHRTGSIIGMGISQVNE